MTILDTDALKKSLRPKEVKYANGRSSWGGFEEPDLLEQAANRIEALEIELLYCKNDYDYLRMVTDNNPSLHKWLQARARAVNAVLHESLRSKK